MFGAHFGALADERAAPDAFVLGKHLHALGRALVAVVEVVPLRQRDRRRADELRIEAVYRTRRVAQHAVDAHAELLVFLELLGCLEVLPFAEWLLCLTHEPGLHAHELPHEVADVDNQSRMTGKLRSGSTRTGPGA